MNFRWNSGTISGGLASGHTDIVFILGEFHLVGLGEIEITIRDEDRLNAQSLGGGESGHRRELRKGTGVQEDMSWMRIRGRLYTVFSYTGVQTESKMI